MQSKDTKAIGDKSTGQVLAALLRKEKIVLIPFGDNQRYDLVMDEGYGRFSRVQCKTGRLKNGAIGFNACSYTYTSKKRTYAGEADFFGVYCPELGKVFLVPVKDVSTRRGTLRVSPARNQQKHRVRMADSYLI